VAEMGKNNFNFTDSIPIEIHDAFDREDIGYSLLVKGNAGVGKTTLALNLLNCFEKFEPIYLTTRVAPSSLYSQFPWLKDRLKLTNILDATRTFIPPVKNPQEMKPHLMRTLRFSSVPEFMKIIYEKVEEYPNAIIIIDSWDAIVAEESTGDRKTAETILTEFVRQMNVKLILISESVGISFLDYIVDGIMTIHDDLVEGRTLRSIEIEKIRGVERKQKSYVFTLYNNRFFYCKPFADEKPTNIKPWQITEDKAELFSTGNKSLDDLYQGGFRQGTFNLLEVESSVPIASYSPIMIGALCNFISQNRGVIVYTMDGINSDLIDKKRLFLHLQTDLISNNMRILMEKLTDRNEIRPYIILTEQNNFNDVFFDVYAKLSSNTKFQPVFAGISYDTLQFMVDFKSAISHFYRHLKMIRNSNVIELGIINTYKSKDLLREGQVGSLTEDMSYAADTHIKIIERHGAILIFGIKPRTGLFYLKNTNEKGYPQVSLIPIV
jgi:KaiC/GvpD/RAD55 family RecA-like ATPase